MKTLSLVLAAVLVAAGLATPAVVLADENPQTPPVVDVKLHPNGTLLGQVVTPDSAPVAEAAVSLVSRGRELAAAKTDENGYFAFAGLQDGVYQLVATEGQGTFRVWSAKTAPPAAQPGALIVNGTDTVRGAPPMKRVRNALANPVVAGGLIAAGIAIPIALDESDEPGTR